MAKFQLAIATTQGTRCIQTSAWGCLHAQQVRQTNLSPFRVWS